MLFKMIIPRIHMQTSSRACRKVIFLLDIQSTIIKSHQQWAVIPKRTYTNRNLMSLKDRGLISAIFPNSPPAFADLCNGKVQTAYAGFDPTAGSLHIGNLAVINMLIHCQRAGHRVIALIGGATGRIGDPSGRNTERTEQAASVINENCVKITENIQRVFENHEKHFWSKNRGDSKNEELPQLKFVNNLEWYNNLSCLDIIGHFGRYFRVNVMLGREAVKNRLALESEGLSYTEFSYQIFQAYDWFHLHNNFGCNIQIGGHDQMGNIISGHDLISQVHQKQVYGLTVPLLTTHQGSKYGKSAGNAIWLDPTQTTPFDLYQFLIRSTDADVEKLLYVFTFKTKQEIEAIMKKHRLSPEKRKAQIQLANDVTLLVHGEAGLQSAVRTTDALYSDNVEVLSKLTREEVFQLFKDSNTTVGTSDLNLEQGTTILDMALKAGCFKNSSDAVRIIEAGGFYLNQQRIKNFEQVVVPGVHILPNKMSLARVGKKHYYIVNWSY